MFRWSYHWLPSDFNGSCIYRWRCYAIGRHHPASGHKRRIRLPSRSRRCKSTLTLSSMRLSWSQLHSKERIGQFKPLICRKSTRMAFLLSLATLLVSRKDKFWGCWGLMALVSQARSACSLWSSLCRRERLLFLAKTQGSLTYMIMEPSLVCVPNTMRFGTNLLSKKTWISSRGARVSQDYNSRIMSNLLLRHSTWQNSWMSEQATFQVAIRESSAVRLHSLCSQMSSFWMSQPVV